MFCSAISLALRHSIYYPPVSSHGCYARAAGCAAACQSPDVRLPRHPRAVARGLQRGSGNGTDGG
ncbi:hypothetical protein F8B43_2102 [Methylorubrum populi]|uniref:Uncharacterized protein n=1 Tax=Methylorubrum populi TaxID=223967 RepID=A0A833J8T2_9HYPH|nr:hypothetical protein F8B43_2102 [Methylorubrum populi]